MSLSRRKFVQGLSAVGIGAAALKAVHATPSNIPSTHTGDAPVLSGRQFELVIDETLVNFTGKARLATTINGSIPGPTLRWKQGEVVTIKVKKQACNQHIYSLARHHSAVSDGRCTRN
jgi:FtsP/CotA-like multicopper oxidase with cupredoxin domain